MPKYKCLECLDCRELFYGWSINDRCQRCGGELREADDDKKYPDNRKYRKVEGYYKEDPENSLSKLLRSDI